MNSKFLYIAGLIVALAALALATLFLSPRPAEPVSEADIIGTWIDPYQGDNIPSQDFTAEMDFYSDGGVSMRSLLSADNQKEGSWSIVDRAYDVLPELPESEEEAALVQVAFNTGEVEYFALHYDAQGSNHQLRRLSGNLSGQYLNRKTDDADDSIPTDSRPPSVPKEPSPEPEVIPAPITSRTETGVVLKAPSGVQLGKTYASYELVFIDTIPPWHYEQQLVGIDTAGKRTVLILSVRSAFAAFPKQEWRTPNVLLEIAYPKVGTRLYFSAGLGDSDAPSYGLYYFDLGTYELAKLPVATSYQSEWTSYTRPPSGLRFLSLGTTEEALNSGKTLFVVEIPTESAMLIKTLGEGESFVFGTSSFAGMPEIEWKWIDEETIEIGVFDTTQEIKDEHGHIQYPLLRTETIKVPK